MAYGIYTINGNDTLQIDSSNPYSYFKATAVGSGTSVVVPDGSLIFVRPSAATTAGVGAVVTGSPQTYSFYSQAYTPVTLNYVVATNSIGTAGTSGYGLQIFNSDSQLAYDSSVFVAGSSSSNIVQIKNIVPKATPAIIGNYSVSSSIVYTGADYLSVYVNIKNSRYSSLVGQKLNGYKWNSTDSTIRFSSTAAGPFGAIYGYAYFDIIMIKVI